MFFLCACSPRDGDADEEDTIDGTGFGEYGGRIGGVTFDDGDVGLGGQVLRSA